VSTFKFTTDPQAEGKIHDVVGLYLNPPTNAVVLSVDEKPQIQASAARNRCCPCGQDCRPGRPTTIAAVASARPQGPVEGEAQRSTSLSGLLASGPDPPGLAARRCADRPFAL
jgi:hypothetical protein